MSDKNEIYALGDGSYYLNDCVIHQQSNEIVVGDKTIKVRRKTMEVLAYLAARNGFVVDRNMLLFDVWQSKPSTDAVLTQIISDLRKIFTHATDHAPIIETIPKVGYRLVAEVKAVTEGMPLKQVAQLKRNTINTDNLSVNKSLKFVWISLLSLAFVIIISVALILFKGSSSSTFAILGVDKEDLSWVKDEKDTKPTETNPAEEK